MLPPPAQAADRLNADRLNSEDLFPCCGRVGLALLLLDLFRAMRRRRAG